MNLEFLKSSNILNSFFNDFQKGRNAELIGTISQKTGKKKVAENKWVDISKENNTNIKYDELFKKFQNTPKLLSISEIAELRKYDTKNKINSAFLLNDLYLNTQQKETKYKLLENGFKNFDYRKIKSDLDNIFNLNGTLSIGVDLTGKLSFMYENKKVKLDRYFSLNNFDNTIIADHNHFKIDEKIQGKGYAKHILKMFYNSYKKANVKTIKLLANSDIGGYAWAKYGFVTTKEQIEATITIELNKKSHLKKYTNDIISKVNDFYSINKESTPFPTILIARLTDNNNKQYGKELLLDSDWEGSLDLNNNQQRTIFENYLNNEIKDNSDIENFVEQLPEIIDSTKIYKQQNDLPELKLKDFKNKIQSVSKGNLDEFMLWQGNTENIDVFNISPISKLINKNDLLNDIKGNSKEENLYFLKYDKQYYSINEIKATKEILSNKEKIKGLVYELK